MSNKKHTLRNMMTNVEVAITDAEASQLRADGARVTNSIRGSSWQTLHVDHDKYVEVIGSFRNHSRRKRAQKELDKSMRRGRS